MEKRITLPKHKFHIQAGDTVVVIGGNSKGLRGVVKEVIVEKDRARVEGVAMITKHLKPTASNPQGNLVKTEGSVHISNLMLVESDAEQVGLRTTSAVVQAIFLVIVLDAFFAVFFTWVGWN